MKRRRSAYRGVQHALNILDDVDEEIARVLQTFDHLHVHVLTEHAREFVLGVRRARNEYHELQGVILALGVDEVLEELGGRALNITAILHMTWMVEVYHDFVHQLINQRGILAKTPFAQRSHVVLMYTPYIHIRSIQMQFWIIIQDKTRQKHYPTG